MLDDTKEDKTIKLLETAVLLMEGASEEDVKLINSTPVKKAKESDNNQAASEGDSGEAKPENMDDKKRDKFRFGSFFIKLELNKIKIEVDMKNPMMKSRIRMRRRKRTRVRMTRKKVSLLLFNKIFNSKN